VFANSRLRDRLWDRFGSEADRKHRVRLRYNNTGAAAPSDSLLPGGTYRIPELTRKQLIATAVKAGFTRARAEQSLARERINQTATFTLTLERGQWTQSFSYDRIREGVGFEATYKVIDQNTVVVTEPEGDETSSSTRWRETPSGSVSRTSIHSSCASTTPSARGASSYGKARRSAWSSCHRACWSQVPKLNAGRTRGRGG
jgi:hypothetical protein